MPTVTATEAARNFSTLVVSRSIIEDVDEGGVVSAHAAR